MPYKNVADNLSDNVNFKFRARDICVIINLREVIILVYSYWRAPRRIYRQAVQLPII